MKIYKFKLLRTSLLNNGAGDLEAAVNQYSKDDGNLRRFCIQKPCQKDNGGKGKGNRDRIRVRNYNQRNRRIKKDRLRK